MAGGILSRFGWEFILLEYEFKPHNSRNFALDIHDKLTAITEKHVIPLIEKEMQKCNFSSTYERKRILSYVELLEKRNLYQKVEIMYILELLKDKDMKPDMIMLHGTRWRQLISENYNKLGYRTKFYTIPLPLKLKRREGYFKDPLAEMAIKDGTLFNLALVGYTIVSSIFRAGYLRIVRCFNRSIPSTIGKFDICSLVPGYYGTKFLNDFHWKKVLSANKHRTLAIIYAKLDNDSYSKYGYLAEQWISLTRVSTTLPVYSAFYWLWPIYSKILVRNLGHFLRNFFCKNIPSHYKANIALLFVNVSMFEALFKLTGVRIFWSSVELNDAGFIAGTIAINRLRGVSLGATWSAYDFPGFSSKRNINDIVFVWGERHVKLFLQGGAVFKSMVMSGYPGDYYLKNHLRKAAALKVNWKSIYGNKKVLCFYDNTMSKDGINNFSETIRYIRNMLLWTIKNPEVLLVIKTKRKDIYNIYPVSITELLRELKLQQGIIYESERGDLAPGLASDVVLGFGVSSLSCLLGTYGKNVILFDGDGCNKKWPIGAENITLIEKPEDIGRMLDIWIKEVCENDVYKNGIEINPTPNMLDGFADGKSAERITEYISSLAEKLNCGSSPDKAIYAANMRYRQRWGLKSVVKHEDFFKGTSDVE